MSREYKDPKEQAREMVMDICCRIERMCRYSPLDDKEVGDESIKDRTIVAGLYRLYRNKGESEKAAGKLARINAIRLVLNEVFA